MAQVKIKTSNSNRANSETITSICTIGWDENCTATVEEKEAKALIELFDDISLVEKAKELTKEEKAKAAEAAKKAEEEKKTAIEKITAMSFEDAKAILKEAGYTDDALLNMDEKAVKDALIKSIE